MGTQWVGPTMTVAEQADQAVHDLRHPGLICQSCPTEIAHQRELWARRDAWRRREEWRRRWLPWIVGAILIGCWLLGLWLLGPS